MLFYAMVFCFACTSRSFKDPLAMANPMANPMMDPTNLVEMMKRVLYYCYYLLD
jgi:hypothetical protein